MTITYNQSRYITDALEGFCMQKCNFPFVCTIVDDASTDGEQKIINKYLDEHFNLSDTEVAYKKETDYANIIFAQHKVNTNCFFVVLFLKENHYSRGLSYKKDEYVKKWREGVPYIAICEGDDYWIDNEKLQKQVDYLDSHMDYGLVYTGYKILYNTKFVHESANLQPEGNVYEELLVNMSNFICTPTVCFRQELFNQVKDFYMQPYFKMGDLPLWLALSKISKFKFIIDNTAVYRKLESSLSHYNSINKTLEFDKNVQEIKLYFARLNNDLNCIKILNRRISQYDSMIALSNKRYVDFFRYLIRGRGINRSLLKFYLKVYKDLFNK